MFRIIVINYFSKLKLPFPCKLHISYVFFVWFYSNLFDNLFRAHFIRDFHIFSEEVVSSFEMNTHTSKIYYLLHVWYVLDVLLHTFRGPSSNYPTKSFKYNWKIVLKPLTQFHNYFSGPAARFAYKLPRTVLLPGTLPHIKREICYNLPFPPIWIERLLIWYSLKRCVEDLHFLISVWPNNGTVWADPSRSVTLPTFFRVRLDTLLVVPVFVTVIWKRKCLFTHRTLLSPPTCSYV